MSDVAEKIVGHLLEGDLTLATDALNEEMTIRSQDLVKQGKEFMVKSVFETEEMDDEEEDADEDESEEYSKKGEEKEEYKDKD